MFAQVTKMISRNALNVVRILNHCGSDDHADFLAINSIFCIAFLCNIKGDHCRMDNWLINLTFLTFSCYIPLLKMSFCDLLRAEWVFILLPVVFVCPVSVFVVWDKVYSCFFFQCQKIVWLWIPHFYRTLYGLVVCVVLYVYLFVSLYDCFLGAFSSVTAVNSFSFLMKQQWCS